jgi:hypothetical protein
MSQAGLGAMIHALSGGNKNDPKKYVGKTIKEIEQIGDHLDIRFEDGVSITILDDGQSCCEDRYMKCDDNLSELVGQKLIEIKVKDITEDDGNETHEIAFLEIQGEKSAATFSFHNEHNGYYGGFGLEIREHK